MRQVIGTAIMLQLQGGIVGAIGHAAIILLTLATLIIHTSKQRQQLAGELAQDLYDTGLLDEYIIMTEPNNNHMNVSLEDKKE